MKWHYLVYQDTDRKRLPMNSNARQGYRQHCELLQRELGQWAASCEVSLTPKHWRIVQTLDWLDVESMLGYAGKRAGAPERSRLALAQAFIAKAVLRLGQTKQLRERLAADSALRRLLGFESNCKLPSEATFSRAFKEFAKTDLPARLHEALIKAHLGQKIMGHIARDATAIHARERAVFTLKPPKVVQPRGRRPKDAPPVPPPLPRSRIPLQLLQTPLQALADLPKACNKGKKRDAHGHINAWVGYKLHLDVACCGVPITAVLTSASVQDSQVSVPLAGLSAQRVTSLYTLMDAAYDSEALRQFEEGLGHVPIVAINSRGRLSPPTLDEAERKRFGVRTVVERVNSRLKDSFACDSVWVKGHAKVLCHTMFAVLALSVDALMRLMLFGQEPQALAEP
jgi:hypothetical protein